MPNPKRNPKLFVKGNVSEAAQEAQLKYEKRGRWRRRG